MDAVILVGGKGTRLASVVNDLPKPLAPVHGRPFLDYVLDYLIASAQPGRFVLATGHLSEKVRAHYGSSYRGVEIVYSHESEPLGTAGALLNAMRSISLSQPFLMLNGDSFVDADLAALGQLHQTHASGLTMALFRVENAARFGTVSVENGRVCAFQEKSGQPQAGLINSGIYMLQSGVLQDWLESRGALSLEVDVMPQLVKNGCVHALESGSRFIDIGLPETYQAAIDFFPAGSGGG